MVRIRDQVLEVKVKAQGVKVKVLEVKVKVIEVKRAMTADDTKSAAAQFPRNPLRRHVRLNGAAFYRSRNKVINQGHSPKVKVKEAVTRVNSTRDHPCGHNRLRIFILTYQ